MSIIDKVKVVSFGLCLGVLFFCMAGIVGSMEVTNKREMIVIKVDEDKVKVIDNMDNIYEFYGDGYEVGQKVIVTLFNNETPSREDDEIIDVRAGR